MAIRQERKKDPVAMQDFKTKKNVCTEVGVWVTLPKIKDRWDRNHPLAL